MKVEKAYQIIIKIAYVNTVDNAKRRILANTLILIILVEICQYTKATVPPGFRFRVKTLGARPLCGPWDRATLTPEKFLKVAKSFIRKLKNAIF